MPGFNSAAAGGGIWWFTDDALWLTVLKDDGRPTTDDRRPPSSVVRPLSSRGVHLKLTFPGMSPAAHLVAADPQPSKTNYFLGNDATKWRANVPTYGSLRWEGAYPGLNLVFGQAGAGLGLMVESTGDAALAALQLRVEGADTVRIDAAGRLVANTAIGSVALPALLTANGALLQPSLDGDVATFRALSRPFAPFALQTPADDPTDLLYSSYLGGSDSEYPEDIAIGPDGTAYVTGYTTSADFPTTPGAFDTTCGDDGQCDPIFGNLRSDAFVTRVSADGTTLVYSTFLGGGSYDYGYGIAVDGSGAAYVGGLTNSTNFPTTPGAFQTVCTGRCDLWGEAFVTKLSADGSSLVYSTFLGGGQTETVYDLALAADGTAYLGGGTNSRDYPTTPGAYDRTCGTDGRCYVTGYTYSTDFPITPGAFDTICEINTYGYCLAAFVTRVSADGGALDYSTFLGGTLSGTDSYGIALGGDGTAYVTGLTTATDFPTTPSAFQTSCVIGVSGCSDAYLTKLSADGSALVYSTFFGGTDADYGLGGVAVGADGTAYIAGITSSSDFPITPGAFDPTYDGGYSGDGFVSRLSPDLAPLHIAAISPRYRPSGQGYRVGASITVQDDAGTGVEGALVATTTMLPDGRQRRDTRTTNSQGVSQLNLTSPLTGTYTFCVTNVTKYGWLYDPAQNVETCDSVTIP